MFNSFRFRFLALVSVLIAIVIFVLTLISVRQIKNTMFDIFKERGVTAIRQIQETLDAQKFEYLANSLDASDPIYLEECEKLLAIKKIIGCDYLYTMAQKSGTVFTYITDGSSTMDDEENFALIGTDEDISSYGSYPFEAIENSEITIGIDTEEQDAWSQAMSVYAPIINASGKTLGIIAIDFSTEKLLDTIGRGRLITICTGFISVVLLIVVSVLAISPFFRRLKFVAEVMDKISAGSSDLTARIPLKSGDEIDLLASSCNKVMAHIQGMVKTVKNNVGNLTGNMNEMSEQTETM